MFPRGFVVPLLCHSRESGNPEKVRQFEASYSICFLITGFPLSRE
ncbi:hypothetical protein RFEPED_0353 [Rickettsia felis str. Pedreira]|uniref:Uncharacterized protein n=1 Tax=Rickettsia felis str. Pedreira TaxID=1359196 RepID=A0A0F3MR99_RICFI|nr:hypothetical protein RFEPED_0353 [Rickettsia felis str. Pedreira]